VRENDAVSDQVFHTLLSLVAGPRHGYGIIQAVEARTGGSFTIGSGTLYSALKRMESDGWVERVDGPDSEDPRRKYYGLTTSGRKVMVEEARRLTELARYARELLPERGC
jgi:DNA-binding PadR family transcriptional regulator